MAEPAAADVLKVVMDEFKALRDEINQRATYCHTLININIVASTALVGVVLSYPNRVELLLILPILSPILGLLWIDHSYAIRNIGDYINEKLQPAVVDALKGGNDLLRWEGYLDEHERTQKKLLRVLPLGIPILVVFGAVPLLALIQSIRRIEFQVSAVLWVSGLLLTVAFLWLWFRLIFAPYIVPRTGKAT